MLSILLEDDAEDDDEDEELNDDDVDEDEEQADEDDDDELVGEVFDSMVHNPDEGGVGVLPAVEDDDDVDNVSDAINSGGVGCCCTRTIRPFRVLSSCRDKSINC